MDLKEIRAGYRECLSAYNAIFPLDPATKKDAEDMMDRFAEEVTERSAKIDSNARRISRAKAKKALPTQEEGADQLGNAITWRRGDSLDGLNQDTRERIERALKFGI